MERQKGTSLVELMVVTVIMGVIGLGISTLISQLFAAQKIVEQRQDIANIAQEVQTIFSSKDICQSSLIPGTVFNLAQAQSKYPPVPGVALTGMPFQFKLNGDTLKSAAVLQNYAVNSSQVLLVNAADTTATDSGGNPIYRADMVVVFAPKTGNNAFSARLLVSGFFTVSGGNVATCSATPPPAMQQAKDACTLLGGAFANGVCTMPSVSPTASALCSTLGGTLTGTTCSLPQTNSGGSSATPTPTPAGGQGTWGTYTTPSSGRDVNGNPLPSSLCPNLTGYFCSPIGSICRTSPITGSYQICQ